MKASPPTDLDLRDKVYRELEQGETIQWIDMPIPRSFTVYSTASFFFAIPWTAFAVFRTFGAADFRIPDISEGLGVEDGLHHNKPACVHGSGGTKDRCAQFFAVNAQEYVPKREERRHRRRDDWRRFRQESQFRWSQRACGFSRGSQCKGRGAYAEEIGFSRLSIGYVVVGRVGGH